MTAKWIILPLTVTLLSAVLVGILPTAAAQTSAGVSCAIVTLPSACAYAYVESWWECGADSEGCLFHMRATVTAPPGHCAYFDMGGYTSIRPCGDSEPYTLTEELSSATFYPLSVFRVEVALCIDGSPMPNADKAPQCARWNHYTSPVPPGDEVTQEDIDRFRYYWHDVQQSIVIMHECAHLQFLLDPLGCQLRTPGVGAAANPPDPKVVDHNDGSCTYYDDANHDGVQSPGETSLRVACPDAKTATSGCSAILYDDKDGDNQVDAGEQLARSPQDDDCDLVPDELEPVLCSQQNSNFNFDGTCVGDDYTPVTPAGLFADVEKILQEGSAPGATRT